MEIWADSCDSDRIAPWSWGLLAGVTTNPAILSTSSHSTSQTIDLLLDKQPGLVALQVTATEYKGMIEQAQILAKRSDRIIIKIPVTKCGLQAMHYLAGSAIPIMATAIGSVKQGILAAQCGALYLATYFDWMKTRQINPLHVIHDLLFQLQAYHFESKVLVAALKHEEDVLAVLKMCAHAVTLPPDVLDAFLEDHPIAKQAAEHFKPYIRRIGEIT